MFHSDIRCITFCWRSMDRRIKYSGELILSKLLLFGALRWWADFRFAHCLSDCKRLKNIIFEIWSSTVPKISLGSLWGSVKLCSPSKPIVRPQRFPSTAQMLRTHSKLTKVLITKLVLIKNLSLFMTLQLTAFWYVSCSKMPMENSGQMSWPT